MFQETLRVAGMPCSNEGFLTSTEYWTLNAPSKTLKGQVALNPKPLLSSAADLQGLKKFCPNPEVLVL